MNKKFDSDTDDTDFETENLIKVEPKTSNVYTVFIDDDVDDPNNYRNIFYKLKQAKKEDKFYLIINSRGGLVRTFTQLYNALQETKAKTVAELYSGYSAGGLIAFSCDELIIKDFGALMIHEISGGSIGKASEMKPHVDFIDTWNKNIIEKIYKGFLTEKEIGDVNNGKEMWMLKPEIEKRLKKWTPMRKRNEAKS